MGLDRKGEPNGKRILTDFTARLVARDVLKKWKGLKGEKLENYIDKNFDKSWHIYDSENKKFLDVRTAYYWIRELAQEDSHSA